LFNTKDRGGNLLDVPLAVKRVGLPKALGIFHRRVCQKVGEQVRVECSTYGRAAGEWVECGRHRFGYTLRPHKIAYIIKADIEKSGASKRPLERCMLDFIFTFCIKRNILIMVLGGWCFGAGVMEFFPS